MTTVIILMTFTVVYSEQSVVNYTGIVKYTQTFSQIFLYVFLYDMFTFTSNMDEFTMVVN